MSMIPRITIHIDPHYGRIVKDGGSWRILMRKIMWHQRNTSSGQRAGGILEASDSFFAQFIEEVHRRGMKVIIDGVFNHCGSLINGWTGSGSMESIGGYEAGAYVSRDSEYHSFLSSMMRKMAI